MNKTFCFCKILSVLVMILLLLNQGANAEAMANESMAHEAMSSMPGMYGSYVMTREGSGTSWQPDSTPMQERMSSEGSWMLMTQGFIHSVYDRQGGPRGGEKNFSNSMLMLMAQNDSSLGTFGLRSMLSLDPLMGRSGYHLLLQTGETANGKTPLIDRQHPHDAFMELAATYSQRLEDNRSVFIYFGLPGEPALGPPNFMHRWSGVNIPEAPLSHHCLDSTHIAYGVVTLGYVRDKVKLEASLFKGREPDQNRWNIESPKFDSLAARLSYNPSPNWSLQMSHAYLNSPEQLEPDVNKNRSTVSVMYNKNFSESCNWQTVLAWGQNANNPGHTLNAYLLESAANLHLAHTIFSRIERLQEDDLLVNLGTEKNPVFTVNKLSLGYIYDLPITNSIKFGLGSLVSTYFLPPDLSAVYSSRPLSYMLFVRLKLD